MKERKTACVNVCVSVSVHLCEGMRDEAGLEK